MTQERIEFCLANIAAFVEHPRSHSRINELQRQQEALLSLKELRNDLEPFAFAPPLDIKAVLDRLEEELYVGDDGGSR